MAKRARSRSQAQVQRPTQRRAHKSLGESSIRGAYATFGVGMYYELAGEEYVNPHRAQVDALLERAAPLLSYERVLDLCCGAGEVTLAVRRLGAHEVVGVDPYTHLAYERETGRSCLRHSFSDVVTGALDRECARPYSAVICSFAMHLCPKDQLYALVYALFKHTETLVIITPHKRPALETLAGVALRDQLIELTPRKKRVTLKIYEMPEHPERIT